MSLEKITSQDKVLTPDLVKELGNRYEEIIVTLNKENGGYLNMAELIGSPELRKQVLARLGQISIKAAEIDEELRASLN